MGYDRHKTAHEQCPHNHFHAEEIANSITHGIGAFLAVAALVILIVASVKHGTDWAVVGSSIFGASLVVAYVSSMLYHMTRSVHMRHIFKVIDHSSIFILIAGTYTPFTLVPLHGGWGWTLFGITWGLTAVGLIYKCFDVHGTEWISTLIYLAMGWIVVIAIVPIIHHLPTGGLVWLILGGGCYTFGIIFFIWESIPFAHTVWHLFVLAGSICHFFAVLFYVVPLQILHT